MKPKTLLRGLALIALFVAIGFALKAAGQGDLFNKAWIDNQVRGTGLSGEILFVIAATLFASVGLPRQLIAFLGGYAFGLGAGTALAVAATLGGCVLGFYFARFLGRDLIMARAHARIKKVDDFLGENPFTTTLLIRLLPAGSNLFTCLAAGVSSVAALPFFGGSVIGYLPQTIVFALAGSGVNLDPVLRIGLAVVLFAGAGGLGIYLFRNYRRSRAIGADIEGVFGGAEPAPDSDARPEI